MRQAKSVIIYKAVAAFISFSLILTAVFGGSFALLFKKTQPVINTFLPGLDPTGDLLICKEVTHSLGDTYAIPDGISFDLVISLGDNYAGKMVETSQGTKTADGDGNITATIAPGKAIRIKDLLAGTSVTVTEASATGFISDGGAEKSVTIQAGTNEITYNNVYVPGPASSVNLTVGGTKFIEDREWQLGDSFTVLLEYKLVDQDDEWNKLGEASVTYELVEVMDPETNTTSMEPKPDFDKFDFTDLVQNITYSVPGVYSFRVTEVDRSIGGINYDKAENYFDVIVGDADMNGSLEICEVRGYQNASASCDESTGNYHVDVTVNNKYAPAGTATATIIINKRVESMSGDEKSAAGYTFELYDESGSLIATSGETSAAGETFIELTFGAKDAGTTFHYKLQETHSGETNNGMIYDDTVYPISVSIVHNLDGTISAYIYNSADYQTELIEVEPEETEPEQTEPVQTEPVQTQLQETEAVETTSVTTPAVINETDTPVIISTQPKTKEMAMIPGDAGNSYTVSFKNIYDPTDTTVSFSGTKELTGRNLNEGEFTVALYATGDSFTIAEGMEPEQTVSNDAEGSFDFASISYSKVGTYRYVVKEDASVELGGVTYDESVFHVIVTVTDENGTLKASTVITDELGATAEIKFQNSYKAQQLP